MLTGIHEITGFVFRIFRAFVLLIKSMQGLLSPVEEVLARKIGSMFRHKAAKTLVLGKLDV